MGPEFGIPAVSTAIHRRWLSAHPLTAGYGDRTGGKERRKELGGIPAISVAKIPVLVFRDRLSV